MYLYKISLYHFYIQTCLIFPEGMYSWIAPSIWKMINEYTEQEMRDKNIDKTNTVKVQGDSYAFLHWEKD